VIYLAFFFPMAVTRVVLLEFGVLSTGLASLVVTIVAVVSPMVLFWMIRKTGVGEFLFKRPNWAYLTGTRLPAMRLNPRSDNSAPQKRRPLRKVRISSFLSDALRA
jgi:uncharacterized membrane protein YcfT